MRSHGAESESKMKSQKKAFYFNKASSIKTLMGYDPTN